MKPLNRTTARAINIPNASFNSEKETFYVHL